jgi:Arabinose efflux permease
MIYLCRFVAGIGAGGEYGIGMTVLAESFSKQKLGRVSSWVGMAGQIGAILASLLAALILPTLGWHALFLFGVIPVVITFFIRRHLRESTAFTNSSQKKHGNIKQLFATPKIAYQTIALMIMAVVQIAGYFGLMNWLPTIMQKQLNLTVGASTWMIATILGMCAGMLTFGWILDNLGPRLAFRNLFNSFSNRRLHLNFAKQRLVIDHRWCCSWLLLKRYVCWIWSYR